jgi:hypothetical protein
MRRFYHFRVFGRHHRERYDKSVQNEQLVEDFFDELDKYSHRYGVSVVYRRVIARREI